MEVPLRNFCVAYSYEDSKLSDEEITKRRAKVVREIKKILGDREFSAASIREILSDTKLNLLNKMIKLIDLHFFDDKLMKQFSDNKCCVSICMDNRCTKTAGFCIMRGKSYKITLSSKVFEKSFSDQTIKNRGVGKVKCETLIECALMILEHELTHAVCGCNCVGADLTNDSYGDFKGKEVHAKSGHSKTFMSILNNRFGHKTYIHQLFGMKTEADIHDELLLKESLKVGDIVTITLQFNEELKQVLAKILFLNKNDCDVLIGDKGFIKKSTGLNNYAINYTINYFQILGKSSKPFNYTGFNVEDFKIGDKIKFTVKREDIIKNVVGDLTSIIHSSNRLKTRIYDKSVIKILRPGVTGDSIINIPTIGQVLEIVERDKKKVSIKPKVKKTIRVKRVRENPKPKKSKKIGCNKRNPDPPCDRGMIEKKRPNGAVCCYKGK